METLELDVEEAAGGEEAPRAGAVTAGPIPPLLTLLATTARSFLLYDAQNDAIRRFLASLIEGFTSVLKDQKVLVLDVRPFEILFRDKPVYLNRDRDRSLAFRLYRDGVRALTFHEGFDAEELARLLEILSTRYTGVQQHEDDTVTLLWKAGFQSLDVVAVEGLVPEDPEATTPRRACSSEPSPFLPDDADLPLPPSPPPSVPTWVDVEEGAREVLTEQASATMLPEQGLRLLGLLVRALDDPTEHMCFSEAQHLFEEMRDFLLAAENLAPLLLYIHMLRQLARSAPPSWDSDRREAAVRLLVSCGTDRALRRVIHSVPSGERVMRPEFVELFDLVCPDPFSAVTEALSVEENPAGRAVARQLLEHYGKRRGQILRQRFTEARGRMAADLLRSLARLDGEAPAAFLARQCAHPDQEVREEALWHLERIVYTASVGHALLEAFRRTEGEQRRRVLALIERSRDRRFVEPLASLLDGELVEPGEALEVGSVLGRLEGPAGFERWKERLLPKGRFFRRRLSGSMGRQVVAAAAVAQIPGVNATGLLELAQAAANSSVRTCIDSLLAQRLVAGGGLSA